MRIAGNLRGWRKAVVEFVYLGCTLLTAFTAASYIAAAESKANVGNLPFYLKEVRK